MREIQFGLTAQEIIDEFSLRAVRLEVDSDSIQPQVRFRSQCHSATIPKWLLDQLWENLESVVKRLREITEENDKRPAIGVTQTEVQAISMALTAVHDCRTVLEGVLAVVTYPSLARYNARKKELSSDTRALAGLYSSYQQETAAQDWLHTLLENFGSHQEILRDKLRIARNAERGECEVPQDERLSQSQ